MSHESMVNASMAILLGSGEARKLVTEAIAALAEVDYERAELLLTDAQQALRSAHQVHTEVIQAEASESSDGGFPVLFSHAQDTMMATDSEIRMVRRLLPVFRGFNDRLTAVESQTGEGAQ